VGNKIILTVQGRRNFILKDKGKRGKTKKLSNGTLSGKGRKRNQLVKRGTRGVLLNQEKDGGGVWGEEEVLFYAFPKSRE